MRNLLALLAVSTTLAACGGGGGPTFAGGNSPPTGGGTGSSGPGDTHSFENPNATRSYQGIGGAQTFSFLQSIEVTSTNPLTFTGDAGGQTAEIYAAEASTARNSQIQITYDPRAGNYTLEINDPNSNTAVSTRFQDPASRTDFGGAEEPQWGTPNLQFQNIEYFESGDGDPISPVDGSGNGVVQADRNNVPPLAFPESSLQSATFFLQTPGTSTQYVTFAGFVRNAYEWSINEQTGRYQIDHTLSRGAFAFGERTANEDVPTTGSFDLSGNMLATMINNPTIDGEAGPVNDSYFQWIEGSVDLTVDFANDQVRDIVFAGTVSAPQIQALTQYSASFDPNGVHSYVPAGTRFEATGSADIDLVTVGGFLGAIDTARFIAQAGNLFADGASAQDIAITGSSIDGAFFGPNAEEVGGGFRIVGGVPDQRVDILGTFTAGSN